MPRARASVPVCCLWSALLDAACLPALLRVTMHVLMLHDRVMTGDEDAAAEVEALAAAVERR